MIKNIYVYFYINKKNLFIDKIVVNSNNKKHIFISDKNKDLEEENKEMHITLYKLISKLIKEKNLSIEELIDNDYIILKNTEILKINKKLDKEDERFLKNSVLLNILLFLGNIPGTIGLISHVSGISICLANTSFHDKNFNENYKEIEKVTKKYGVDSDIFNLKTRKNLFSLCLAFSIFLGSFTALNKLKEYSNKTINSQIELYNPLSDENIETLSDEDIKKYIIESIDKNYNLSQEDKEICKQICDYALDSEYIDYEELYNDLRTLLIIEKDEKCIEGNYTIVANYFEEGNLITIYNEDYDREVILQHEIIHSTGCFENNFLNEGMTSLIQREYNREGNIESDGYTRHVNVIRFLCELVGPDIVLEAYNKRDDSILYKALAEIYGTEEDAKKVIEIVSKIDIYLKYYDNLSQLTETCPYLLEGLYKYVEAKEDADKTILYYYLESVIDGNDANEVYYFNKRGKTLNKKINNN